MNPTIGDTVRIFFRNNLQFVGIVEKWGTKKSIIRLIDKSVLIIQKTNEDILCVQVLPKEQKKEVKSEPQVTTKPATKPDQVEMNQELRIKKLVELKEMLAKQEKEEIANKLKTHEIKEIKEVKYGLPGFLTKQGA